MDTLSLKKYSRPGSLVDKKVKTLKEVSRGRALRKGNSSLTEKGLAKSEKEFLEFYINDKPLSELLTTFHEMKGNILDNWIGVLGSFPNRQAEIIKLKQLLMKSISDKEIREVFPADWSESEFQYYLERYHKEISDPNVIIYCCAECGDYDCGGIFTKIEKTDTSFKWTFTEKEKRLSFEFNKYQYFDLFNKYLGQLAHQCG
jgi:hypothetical protein